MKKIILLSIIGSNITSNFCMENDVSEGKKEEVSILPILPREIYTQEILFKNTFKNAIYDCLKSQSQFRLEEFFDQIKNIKKLNKSFVKMFNEYIPARNVHEAGCLPFESLLVCAAEKNWVNLYKFILNNINKKDINKNELNGALFLAAAKHNKEIFNMLVAAGADTKLLEAAVQKFLGISLDELLNGKTPRLTIDSVTSVLINNDKEYDGLRYYLVKVLILNNAHVGPSSSGFLPLVHALNDPSTHIFRLLLSSPHINVNLVGGAGLTALHWAVLRGLEEFVKLLLKEGARTDIENSQGDTPLMVAAKRGNFNIVKLLLGRTNRKDIDKKNKAGKMALDIAQENDFEDIVDLIKKFKK